MNTINKPAENMGGLVKIWAVPYNVYSLSGKTVTFSSTDNICEIYCSPDSRQHTEPPERTDAGIIFNTQVTGFVPGNTQSIRLALENMENRKAVAIFRDGNGDFWMAGSYLSPLIFSAAFSTGINTSDRPGHEISLSGQTLEKAKCIDNPF